MKVFLLSYNCLRKTNGCLVFPNIHIKITENNTHQNISKYLDELSSKYDNIIIIVDLNFEISEHFSNKSCQIYNLESIVNTLGCLKSSKNPSLTWCWLRNKKIFENPKPLKVVYLTFIKREVLFLN